MSDVALSWSADAGAWDVSVEANDLATDAGLRTAVLLSLFTDRRAEPGDDLPVSESDRRGWWADAFPIEDDDRYGSRLWLLARSKQTTVVLTRAQEYAKESLQWLITDSIASRVDVTAEFMTSHRGLALAVTLTRPKQDPVRFRFDNVWTAEEARL